MCTLCTMWFKKRLKNPKCQSSIKLMAMGDGGGVEQATRNLKKLKLRCIQYFNF